MAGPYVDPTKAAQVSKGVQEGPPSVLDTLNRIGSQAGLLNQKGKPQLTNVEDPSLMSYEHQPQNPHMQNMEQVAKDAKHKYMMENGVDENGEPVAK